LLEAGLLILWLQPLLNALDPIEPAASVSAAMEAAAGALQQQASGAQQKLAARRHKRVHLHLRVRVQYAEHKHAATHQRFNLRCHALEQNQASSLGRVLLNKVMRARARDGRCVNINDGTAACASERARQKRLCSGGGCGGLCTL